MPDFSLPPCVTLVFGRSGSGKTSFVFRYLANVLTVQPANDNPAACIFIFDWKLEAAQRLGLTACGTVAQCESAVPTRCVLFNPFVMFEQDLKSAFRWFCLWVFEVSRRGPGKKVFFVDELWRFVDNNSLPAELERIARMGRSENLELISATQHPRDYHRDIRAEVTEWVCFSMNEPGELDAVRPYFRGVDRVAELPRGSFIAYNRESGAELAGKLF
jgi:type IV secretory pathway VirB4 component